MTSVERCIVCGDAIPSGRQVCYECEHRILDETNTSYTYEEIITYIKENLKHGTESSDY